MGFRAISSANFGLDFRANPAFLIPGIAGTPGWAGSSSSNLDCKPHPGFGFRGLGFRV